ncbi:MAG: bifunctional hydroxymethylpyrimidine kinase/phosphomethylpyrimidine kinase [Massilia sp.]
MADPVGARGVQADLAVFSALGCHGLSVMTGYLVADTARVEDCQEIEADWVVDQARVLLEDMRVAAIKVGAISNIEQATAIAEIVSDYPDVPLILDPFLSSLPDSGMADEDMLIAIRQILVPQAHLLLLSQVELARMAESWRDGADEATEQAPATLGAAGSALAADVAELTAMGCALVLVTCTEAAGSGPRATRSNTLFDAGGEVARHDWRQLAGPFTGAGGTMSAAACAYLARGMAPAEAVAAAQTYTAGALAHAQRFGMGKLVPDPFFQVRPTTPPGASDPIDKARP